MDLTFAIPTWNRHALLETTLASLIEMRPAPDLHWHVLVCDNNSSDATRSVVEAAARKLDLRYLFEPRQGSPHAMRRLVAAVRTEWVVLIDDDVIVEPDFAVAWAEAIASHPEASVIGGQVLPRVAGQPSRLGSYLIDAFPWVHAVLRIEQPQRVTLGGRQPHGPNVAFRAAGLREEGAIDARVGMFAGIRVSGLDTEMVRTQLRRGRTDWLVPGPTVHHQIPPARTGLRWFLAWHAGQGRRRVAIGGPVTSLRSRLELAAEVVRDVAEALWRLCRGRLRRCFESLGKAARAFGQLAASRGVPRAR